MKKIQTSFPGFQGLFTDTSLLLLPSLTYSLFLWKVVHVSSLGLHMVCFSFWNILLIFLRLLLSGCLGLSLNCTLQHIYFISCLDLCNHLSAGLSAFLSPTPIPASTLMGFQPDWLSLTWSRSCSPPLLYCRMSLSPFPCHSSCLVLSSILPSG